MWSQTINDIKGGHLFDVQTADYGWARRIGTVSEGSAMMQMRDGDNAAGITPAEAAQLMIPNARMLVNWWDGIPFVASTLVDFDYSRSTGEMQILHADIRYFAGKRFVFGVDGYETGSLVVTGKSQRGLYRAVAAELYGPKSARWELPVDIPADEAGARELTSHNYNLELGEALFTALESATDGPHADYAPYEVGIDTRDIRFALKLGSPLLATGFREYTLGAPESEAIDVGYRIAGKQQFTGVIAAGKGSGSDMRIGKAPELVSDYPVPFMDSKISAKDEADTGVLNDRAVAAGEARRNPTTQWSVKLHMSEAVQLPPGSTIRVFEDSDPVIPHGQHDLYVLGVSGDLGATATMEVQEL